MRSPAFPPRRASHLTRYIFPALVILYFFYFFANNRAGAPENYRPAHHEPASAPDNPFADDQSLVMHPPSPQSDQDSTTTPQKSSDKAEEIEQTRGKTQDSTKESALTGSGSHLSDDNTEKPLTSPDRVKGDSDKKSSSSDTDSDRLKSYHDKAGSGSGKSGSSSLTDSDSSERPKSGPDEADAGPDRLKSGEDKKSSSSVKEGGSSGKSKSGGGKTNDKTKEESVSESTKKHPIDHLIKTAEEEFDGLMAKESKTLEEAAQAYRERRGRHPPPGFDEWFLFAQDNEAVVIEDLFDRIYHDLHPFWGVDPKFIRKEAYDFEMTINIRNGNASAESDWFWTQIWLKMIKTIEHLLPDMDLALNAMDEPRIVVPWEEMDGFVQKADKNRKIVPVENVIPTYAKLGAIPSPVPLAVKKASDRRMHWEDTSPFWRIARRGCAPDSPARRLPIQEDFDQAPTMTPTWAAPHQYQGYVSNFSLSTEFCHQPDIQGLAGIFINPLSTKSTRVLFPLFGGSKLATNNEILLPPPMYWNEEDRFTGNGYQGSSWEAKFGPLVWRGIATGGRHKESNWRGFQRHRFVAMNNATQVLLAEEEMEAPLNFELPDPSYDVKAVKNKHLGEWVFEWADVGFTEFMCDPDMDPEPAEGACPYMDEHFATIPSIDLTDQFDFKYLPDIDGNSFSGRYLAFLRSTGVPIKSTLWHEWHDSRLVAWKHFVPMDNRFVDYYGIMEYFLGFDKSDPGHDKVAKKIAMDGKAWAERVLRKEDMQVYVLRLLLEYARVSADDRETMGWVDDLLPEKAKTTTTRKSKSIRADVEE